ncbi:MAG: AAA family ATPase [Candidatus Nanohaloarchaea archaeon]
MAEDENVKLRVGEVPPNAQQDIGRGIVRIDSKVMEELGITEGDAVEIEGNRETVGRVARSYPADKGLGIARMDGYMRKNAGTSLGEKVDISKVELEPADKITLAPAEEGVVIQVSNPDVFKRALAGRAVTQGDIVVPGDGDGRKSVFEDIFDMNADQFRFSFGGETKLAVVSTQPSGAVEITQDTEIEMKQQAVESTEKQEQVQVPDVTYEDIGGLDEEIQNVREMIELPLKHPEVFQQLGIEAPSGVLLHGPPGTGKTLLAKAVANEADATFMSINGPEIMSKYYGESEKQLREKFEEAQENSPAIIFIDEIDAIASKRSEAGGEVERRVVAQLLSLMDGLEERENVIVIAATNRVDAVDEALRRGGRFDREIEIGVPNSQGRKEIMQIHTRNMPLTDEVDLEELADKTHGYVGADLEAVCKEAAMSVLRNVLPEIDLDEEIPSEVMEKLVVGRNDMMEGIRKVQPSAMREVMVEVPKVSWEDVGGLSEAQDRLKEMVEWPQLHPERFDRMGIEVPKGILLYGLPGTGKTLLAKAVANEANANFISIKGPEIFCLSGDTPVVTDFCGRRSVKEFYDRAQEVSKKIHEDEKKTVFEPQEEIKTRGIDEHGEVVESEVERFYKIQVPESFRLRFEDGSEVHVSGNQPFYTRDGWKKASELEEENLVASPARVESFGKDRLEWTQLDQENFYVEQERDLVPLEEAEVSGEVDLTYARKLTSEEKTIRLPSRLTPELSELLGWIAAEGNISDDEVRIAAKDEENRKRVRELLENVFSPERINERDDGFAVYSKAFVEFLHQGFEFPRENKTSTVGVPGMLFKSSEENWNAFLHGSFRGDGYIGDKKVEYCSASEDLVDGIKTLLRFKGHSPRKFEDGNGYYHLNLSGRADITRFRSEVMDEDIEIEEDNQNKQKQMPAMNEEVKLLRDGLRMTYGRDIEEGVIAPIVERDQQFGRQRAERLLDAFRDRMREVRELEIEEDVESLRNAKNVLKVTYPELEMEIGYSPKYQLKEKEEFGEKHSEIREYLERVKESILSEENFEAVQKLETASRELSWKKIQSISEEGSTTMYDLETETGSLIGGQTPLMLHNSKFVGESEESIREVFQKARQVAPCILFIDEIDSIATKRGSRSDSGVGDRVVNQLLTELDGIEDLEGVTVIAATNRPDLIDPAILRPGRVDRSIEVDIPDAEARRKILEVHTEEMPLADDVDMDELAEATEGYVGSDIEALCREAGMISLRRDPETEEATMEDFRDAMDEVKPTATEENVQHYEQMMQKMEEIESAEQDQPDYYA